VGEIHTITCAVHF